MVFPFVLDTSGISGVSSSSSTGVSQRKHYIGARIVNFQNGFPNFDNVKVDSAGASPASEKLTTDRCLEEENHKGSKWVDSASAGVTSIAVEDQGAKNTKLMN